MGSVVGLPLDQHHHRHLHQELDLGLVDLEALVPLVIVLASLAPYAHQASPSVPH